MNKKLIIGLVVVLVLAVAAYFLFFRKKEEAPATDGEKEKAAEATAGRGGPAILEKPVAVGAVVRPGAVLAGQGKGPVAPGGRPGALLATQGRG